MRRYSKTNKVRKKLWRARGRVRDLERALEREEIVAIIEEQGIVEFHLRQDIENQSYAVDYRVDDKWDVFTDQLDSEAAREHLVECIDALFDLQRRREEDGQSDGNG